MEKLTEETLRDWNHFLELLAVCQGNPNVPEIALYIVSYPMSCQKISTLMSFPMFPCSSKAHRRDFTERNELEIAPNTKTCKLLQFFPRG